MSFTFSKDKHTKFCDGCGVEVDSSSGHICADEHHIERRERRGLEPKRVPPAPAPVPAEKVKIQ